MLELWFMEVKRNGANKFEFFVNVKKMNFIDSERKM